MLCRQVFSHLKLHKMTVYYYKLTVYFARMTIDDACEMMCVSIEWLRF